MSIEKHSTNAFVLARYEQGEHDLVYKLFTDDFGLLMARATSIRKLESKLRPHMHIGREIRVTLVKGKEVWRLTGAEEVLPQTNTTSVACKIIERFIRGEGKASHLFQRVSNITKLHNTDIRLLQILLYFVILVDLGYANAEVIGVKDVSEYKSMKCEDLYTHLVLSEQNVKKHVRAVLAEMQL